MAEGGAKNIGKVLQKTVIRTKEKVLQNLGKADRTKDDQFELHEINFNEQLVSAQKLQKVLKSYTERLKEMSLASGSLYRTMKEVYGDDWVGYTDFCAAHEEVVSTWQNYSSQIDEMVVSPLTEYIALFPKYKEKMAKRKRKLTDYDSARHSYDSVSSAKKMDDNKISKAQEELNEARHIYESINISIIEELSEFHKSRIHLTSSVFHNLIGSEIQFHSNSLKVKNVMNQAVGKLMQDAEKFRSSSHDISETPQGSRSAEEDQRYVDLDFKMAHQALVPSHKSKISMKNQSANNGSEQSENDSSQVEQDVNIEPLTQGSDSSSQTQPQRKPEASPVVPAPTYQTVIALKSGISKPCEGDTSESSTKNINQTEDVTQKNFEEKRKSDDQNFASTLNSNEVNGDKGNDTKVADTSSSQSAEANGSQKGNNDLNTELKESEQELYDVPVPIPKNQSIVPSSRILFKVKATHSYVGEDTDELTFEAGEMITVVPFDHPDEQDEGWLMGVKESTRERGVFPENFTIRLD